MGTPMAKKTKATLLVGFVVFVGGSAGAAYLGTRDRGGAGSVAGKVDVLYADRPMEAGTAGSTALAQGLVKRKTIPPSARSANALTDPTQLAGGVAASAIPAGTVLTADMFPPPQTRIGTVVIPSGKRALALELQPVPGVAGFVGAGDHVDVYSVARGEDGSVPGVHLILQGVQVLNVNGTGLPSAQGQPAGPNFVYLLAVTPLEAERLIYLAEFQKLYFDLVAKGEPPVATPGAGPAQALQAL
jgi:pilus assembly protein CpaB